MYDKNFAEIYNENWAEFSENLALKIIKLTDCHNSILDLGCGTGNFLKIVEKSFDRAVGIDLSPEMIKIARKNCKKAFLKVESVTDFDFDEKFDVITCNFDMINHLQSFEEWKEVFKRVYNHLKDNGVFVFDFNTVFKLHNFDFQEHYRESEGFNFLSKNTKLDSFHARMYIQIFDKSGNKVAEVDEVESFFDEKTILEGLNRAGFQNVRFVDFDLNEVQDYNCKRLFAICGK